MIRRAVAVGVGVVAVLAACGTPRENETTREPVTPAPTTAAVGNAPLRAADVKLSIKVTEKDCFGDIGCNVGYRVRAAWPPGRIPAGQSYEVTYRVTGPESGPTIGTLILASDGTYTGGEEYASTPRVTTVLKPVVTEVERAP